MCVCVYEGASACIIIVLVCSVRVPCVKERNCGATMSVRTKMLGFVDVILRVPPIFIIDEILKISMGLPFATQNDSTVLDGSSSSSQITTISGSAGVPTDSMLFNDNSSSSTISSSNFSSNSSSSSLEQFLNTSSAELFGDAMSAAAAAAAANSAAAADDTEFYKIVSLTSLKFLSCLLGK